MHKTLFKFESLTKATSESLCSRILRSEEAEESFQKLSLGRRYHPYRKTSWLIPPCYSMLLCSCFGIRKLLPFKMIWKPPKRSTAPSLWFDVALFLVWHLETSSIRNDMKTTKTLCMPLPPWKWKGFAIKKPQNAQLSPPCDSMLLCAWFGIQKILPFKTIWKPPKCSACPSFHENGKDLQ